MPNRKYPFENEPLPYDYAALEPYIDTETMHFHHDKHLQTYVDNLNAALSDCEELHSMSLEEILAHVDELPEQKRTAVRNNGGGVYNHLFYFAGLEKCEMCSPSGEFGKAIAATFGSFEAFCAEFKKAALGVFGSGYAWVVRNGATPEILTTKNQETPLASGKKPVLCIDVWEHAYYLKNKNLRGAYIDNWFHVINWERAESLWTSEQN